MKFITQNDELYYKNNVEPLQKDDSDYVDFIETLRKDLDKALSEIFGIPRRYYLEP